MRLLLTITSVSAVLAVAGCGGSDNNDSSSSPSGSTGTQQSTSSGGTASTGGKTVTINMQNIQFAPKSVSAKVGQTVKWVNMDTVDHNVKADSGETFKSKDFGQGGSFSYKLDKAGTIEYECTLHPGMTGTITVTK